MRSVVDGHHGVGGGSQELLPEPDSVVVYPVDDDYDGEEEDEGESDDRLNPELIVGNQTHLRLVEA